MRGVRPGLHVREAGAPGAGHPVWESGMRRNGVDVTAAVSTVAFFTVATPSVRVSITMPMFYSRML